MLFSAAYLQVKLSCSTCGAHLGKHCQLSSSGTFLCVSNKECGGPVKDALGRPGSIMAKGETRRMIRNMQVVAAYDLPPPPADATWEGGRWQQGVMGAREGPGSQQQQEGAAAGVGPGPSAAAAVQGPLMQAFSEAVVQQADAVGGRVQQLPGACNLEWLKEQQPLDAKAFAEYCTTSAHRYLPEFIRDCPDKKLATEWGKRVQFVVLEVRNEEKVVQASYMEYLRLEELLNTSAGCAQDPDAVAALKDQLRRYLEAQGGRGVDDFVTVQDICLAAFLVEEDCPPQLLLVKYVSLVLCRDRGRDFQGLCGSGEVGVLELWENVGDLGQVWGKLLPGRFLAGLGDLTLAAVTGAMTSKLCMRRMWIKPWPPEVSAE